MFRASVGIGVLGDPGGLILPEAAEDGVFKAWQCWSWSSEHKPADPRMSDAAKGAVLIWMERADVLGFPRFMEN